VTVDLRESPGAHLAEACAAASVPGAVTLREIPFTGQAEVRVRGGAAGLAETLGALPGAGRAEHDGTRTVGWCGPGWYLLVDDTGHDPAAGLHERSGLSVVDTSAARTILELRGPYARDVLETGCAIDLHPRAFAPGSFARTLLAKATVCLEQTGAAQTDPTPTYRIHVGTSFTDYLTHWLLDAMDAYRTNPRAPIA